MRLRCENLVTKRLEVTKAEKFAPPSDWNRLRFATCVSIFAGSLGTVTTLVYFLTTTEPNQIPEHMPFFRSLVFGIGGALGAGVFTWPFTYLIYGRGQTFYHDVSRDSFSIWVWLGLGVAFALTFSLVMGASFLPMGLTFIEFAQGIVNVPGFVLQTFDNITGLWSYLAFYIGFRLVFVAFAAGAIFGPGGWLIHKFSSSTAANASMRLYVTTAVLSLLVLSILVFTPPRILAGIS